jgi:polyvinyl alcohol dehydrogenase (cytochrome)
MQRVRRRLVAAVALAAAAIAPPALASHDDRPPADSQWDCGDWGMFGRTLSRTFSTEGCPSPINADTVATLVPAWTFRPHVVNPDDQITFTASPVVVGDTVYIGGWDGVMYALDRDDGTVRWQHATPPAAGATFGPIVSSAAVTTLPNGRRLVVFGAGPRVVALDAGTGAPVWSRYVGAFEGATDPNLVEYAEVESSPAVYRNVVYVGMDVHDHTTGETGGVRGGLLALDATTGAVLAKYEAERFGRDTVPPIEPLAPAAVPDGGCGGVWGSPAIDAARGQVYVGTANCYDAADDNVLPMEELAALPLVDQDRPPLGAGAWRPRWRFFPHVPAENEDLDFGATPNLVGDVVGVGNKDGRYYVVDAATGALRGKSAQLSRPVPNVGGFIGSTAVYGRNAFGATAIGVPPWYHSVSLDTVAGVAPTRWQGLGTPSYAGSAATDGVVFAGAIDNLLKAYDQATGVVRWVSPLLGPISSAPSVVGDMVFVGSGTSSSDLCEKENPTDPACRALFETVLGQQGGVHAFRLAGSRTRS